MTPYYTDDYVTLYHGDSREVLPDVIDVLEPDVIVTDPPYGIEWESGLMPGSKSFSPIVGDDSTVLAEWVISTYWPAVPMVVFGAHCFPHLLPEPGRWIVWDKRLSEQADKMFGSPVEMAWRSGPTMSTVMYRILHSGCVDGDSGGRAARRHPTQKPVKLFRQIIEDLCPADGRIVDPFAGSGSTLRAAKDLGRRSVGVEVDESYCEVIAERCAQEVLVFD